MDKYIYERVAGIKREIEGLYRARNRNYFLGILSFLSSFGYLCYALLTYGKFASIPLFMFSGLVGLSAAYPLIQRGDEEGIQIAEKERAIEILREHLPAYLEILVDKNSYKSVV